MTSSTSDGPARTLAAVSNFAGEPGSTAFMDLDADRYLDAEILRTGLCEADLTRYLLGVLAPGMTAVDVGANIGYYTILFARRCARVLAFEPIAEYRSALRRSVQANGFANVEIFPCGLSNARGEMTVATGLCSATIHWIAEDAPRRVEHASFERLDDIVKERVDLLKIDVDGHELRVLQGAAGVIRTHRPTIVFEVSLPHYRAAGVTLQQCYGFLEEAGYALACESAPRQRLPLDQFLSIAADECRSWNFIATPGRNR